MAEDNNSMKMLIIITLLVVIIASGTSFTVMKFIIPGSGNENSGGDTAQKSASIGPTYILGDFTVNLANTGGYKFLKASLVAEISDKKVVDELDSRKPQIRDIIISILRSQEIQDIEEPESTQIKTIIKEKINETINNGDIINIWFTQFVVQ